jgi:hypothetical protein
MAVTYKGNSDTREVSRERALRGNQSVYTIERIGKYDDLIDEEPAVGDALENEEDYLCETTKTVKTKGAMGRNTTVYVYDGNLTTVSQTKNIRLEIVWVRNDADLSLQAAFRDDSSGVGDIECRDLIEDYLATRSAAKRTALKTLIDAFGEKAKKYLELRCKGIDHIMRFLPVCRKTSTQLIRYTDGLTVSIGKREDPSFGSVKFPKHIYVGDPLGGADVQDALAYVKMRDDITRSGRNKRWDRTEEWHGFPSKEIEAAMFHK